MTLTRLAIVLVAAVAVMLAVVVLRAERTRLEYQASELEREARVLREELRERKLELARVRNPAVIRARALELMKLPDEPAKPPPRDRGRRSRP